MELPEAIDGCGHGSRGCQANLTTLALGWMYFANVGLTLNYESEWRTKVIEITNVERGVHVLAERLIAV